MSKSLTINAAPMLQTNDVLASVSDNNPGLRMNAVLYIPQTLSAEQQAQARHNIGIEGAGGEIPTKVSQLDNDMNYTTETQVQGMVAPKADLSYVNTLGGLIDINTSAISNTMSYAQGIGNMVDINTSNITNTYSYASGIGNNMDLLEQDLNDVSAYAVTIGHAVDTKANADDVYTKNQVYTRTEVYTKTESDNRFQPLYTPEYITDTNIL